MPIKTEGSDIPNLRDETLAKTIWCDPYQLCYVADYASHHTDEEIERFEQTICDYVGAQPIIIDGYYEIVAGQGRVRAAQLLNIYEIPALRLGELSEDDIEHYLKIMEQFSDFAGWSRNMLQIDLQDLLSYRHEMRVEALLHSDAHGGENAANSLSA